MLKYISNLGKALNKAEQQAIKGGRGVHIAADDDGCQSWVGGVHSTGLSVEDAQGDYQFCLDNGYSNCGYCCASC